MTNSPATSSTVAQLISRTSWIGLLLEVMETTAVITTAARHVGSPRSFFIAEAASSTAIISASPASTSLPLLLSFTSSTSHSMLLERSSRKRIRMTTYVATIDSSDGTPKSAIQRASGGIPVWKTTRFAGFEIGNTKLAAFAINAQANKYGSGETLSLRTVGRNPGREDS